MRIDAHQHFWRYDPVEYAWIDERMSALRRNFLPADAKREMDAAGIGGCVAVQARQTLEETRWLLALADEHPFILGVVGWVDLQAPDIEKALEEVARYPKLVGVRHIVQGEPDDFLARPGFHRGIAMLARFELAYDVLVYERHLPATIDFVERFPAQRFVLDHLGKPDIQSGRIAGWREHMRRLGGLPHVWCKLSGLVTEADWTAWTIDQLRPYVETALECFGADRVMIGSDWPVCTVAASYARAMQALADALPPLSAVDRDAVLGATARRFWNLPTPERPSCATP